MRSVVLPVLAALGLSGCAELTELYCSGADGYRLGERVAARGGAFSAVEQDIAACNATASPLNAERARAGWQAGRAAYCTPSNAFDLGVERRVIGSICSPAERAVMERSYRSGRLAGDIRRDIRDLRHRQSEIRSQLAALSKDQQAERARLLAELLRLDLRRDRLDRRLWLLSLR
ncbi:DUF2799 domain-containing protein [Jannaschia pagri]|nr:DUF2799 domain-containing protein [Jannaschia sp. AI_62]